MNTQKYKTLFQDTPTQSNISEDKPNDVVTYDSDKPPLTLGPRRFFYQYSVLLPQIHLTLVSVLQGIAFGVLLLYIPLPSSISLSAFISYSLEQYFYLPYIVSSIMVLVIWKQFMYAGMFSIWPLSTRHVALIYLIALAEILAFKALSAAALPAWLVGIGFVGLIGGCIRLNNLPFIEKDSFDHHFAGTDKVHEIYRNSQIGDGWLYIGSGLIVIILGIFYVPLILFLKNSNPQMAHFLSWGVLAALTIVMCIILLRDNSYRGSFLSALTENSGLKLWPNGRISYDPKYEGKEHVKKDSSSLQNIEKEQIPQKDMQSIPGQYFLTEKINLYAIFLTIIAGLVGGLIAIVFNRSFFKKM